MTSMFTPDTEWLTLEWHQATVAAGRLCMQRCSDCGRWRHPPRRYCAECFSSESSFVAVAGSGTVESYAVSYRSLDPAWQERAPYATLVVELDEGPRVLAATELQPSEVAIGRRVDLRIDARSDDFAVLWADPAT